jgi:ParB-like chromosome segregation protein Spo0J
MDYRSSRGQRPTPLERKPKKNLKGQALDKLKEKITQNGFHSVIVIDTDNTILSGNQRKTALMELGINK